MEMTTWRASAVMNGILMYMLVLTSLTSGSKIIRTSAKSLAEKAGAAQYAVHIEEELTSAEIGGERKHRASFDDSDYDVYQGVVGRPGIDFPIQASIPQTAFSCALFGNGYFADLETKCQVFHICEGGKKISFLCPNGTIFQQTDLICDWWFRVNCANSPDYYAESSEILSRSQSQPQSSGGSFKPISVADMPSELNQTTMASLQRGLQAPHATPAKLRAGQTFTLRSSSSSSSSSKHLIQQQTNPASSAYSAERFDGDGNLFALKTKDRNSHTARTSAARKLGKAAYETAAQFVPLDVLETQEVAESASFALGRSGHNNFVPIYVRSNVRLDTAQSPQSNSLSNRTQHSIQTNVNIINYLHTPPNDRVNVTKRTFTATAATTTTTAPPISRRGTVMYAGPATKTLLATTNKNNKEPSTVSRTTPNQIHYTESHPKGANKTPRRLQKQRSTQYYTPTVPTIIARGTTTPTTTAATTVPPPSHQDPELPSSSSSSSASSDHAIEMMRILNELMRGNRLLKQNAARLTSGGAEPRSLALYFATGDDNSVSPDGSFLPNSQVKFDLDSTNALDVAVSNATNIASSLLSNDTIRKYDRLFETMDELPAGGVAGRDEEADALSLTAAESANDKRDTDTGNNDVLPAERTPEIRSLAQVFTHALSAYLHDPSTFRQVLSDIRPTEPPTLEAKAQAKRRNERRYRTDQYATTNSFLINTGDDLEVLDFSDVTVSTQQNEANFPSTTPAPNTVRIFQDTETTVRSHSLSNRPAFKYVATADHVPASRLLTDPLEKSALSARSKDSKRNPLALEINGAFVVSTSFPYFQDDSLEYRNETNADTAYSTQSTPASTIYQTTEVPTQMQTETPAFVQLPNLDPFNFDDNDLQRSASASFVGSGNGNNRLLRPQSAALGTSNFPTTTPATTTYQRDSNQRSTLAYTVFLDPLTINDELLLQSSPVTPSLHTYLPKSSGHTDPHTAATTDDDLLLLPTTTESSFISRRGKYFEQSTVAAAAAATNGGGGGSDPEFMDLMQERANEMFGSLNNTSAAHLMNVMKKANKNKTVRKLILLLIQTCDEDYSTTVEQSRTALLNALIGMDSKFNDSIDVKVISPFKYRRGKSNSDEATAAAAFEESVASGSAAAATTTVVTPQATGRSATEADAETTTVTSFFDNNDEDNHRRTTVSEDPFEYYTESSALFETDETLRQAAAVWTTTYAPPTAESADPGTVWTTVAAAAETTTTPAATTTTTTTSQSPRASGGRAAAATVHRSNRHQSRRIVKDLDELLVAEGSQSYDPKRLRSIAEEGQQRSDTRALDLLRSLYTLAGKLGK